MDLELATITDMVFELRRRNVRFVLIATENSNKADTSAATFACHGNGFADVSSLWDAAANALHKVRDKRQDTEPE